MKKVLLLLAVLLSLTHTDIRASHVLGGDISYRCLGNGIFEFTVTVYRDCNTGSAGWNTTSLNLSGPIAGTLALISSTDVTPRCASNTTFNCNPPTVGHGQNGSVARFVYRGSVNLSSLAAAPTSGYTWFVSFPCCRPTLSNMIGSQQALQVKMFPYTNPATGQSLTPAQLCDQSPHFALDPTLVAINNPNDTLHLQYLASDVQSYDSTVYGIDFPLSNTLQPYAYNPPYSQMNPLPSLMGPPFVSAANSPIHPNRGEIVMRPTLNGNFALVVKATSFRQGQRIAEVFRDITLKIIANPAGSPPPFIPNPSNALHSFSQRAPIIYSPRGPAGDSIWNFTYYDEDTIALPILVADLYPLFSGNPGDPSTWVPQTNPFAIGVTGQQLSTSNNPAADCAAPPCATLRGLGEPLPPAPVAAAPVQVIRGNGNPIGLGYTDTVQGGFTFVWIPRADSLLPLSQAGTVRNYQFALTAVDRTCPLEGETNRVMHFRIKPLPVLPRPVFDSISRQNGQSTLHFRVSLDSAVIDPIDVANYGPVLSAQDSAALMARSLARQQRSYDGLNIYKAVNYLGPYQLVARVTDPTVTSWLDSAQASREYYFLELRSGLPVQALPSADTLGNCLLSPFAIAPAAGNFLCNGGNALLTVAISSPNLQYQWYRDGQAIAGATANQLTITLAGEYQVEAFDPVLRCSGVSAPLTMAYYPAVYNEEEICAVTVNPSMGSTTVYWESTPGVHIESYHVYRETTLPGAYEHIGSLAFEAGGIFVDTATAGFLTTRRYRIVAEDFCGERSDSSVTHRPMSLNLVALSNGDVDLSWTPYEGFTVFEYDIMRSTGGAFQVIGTKSANDLTFTDVAPPAGPKVYFVRSLLANGCRPGPIAPIITSIHSNAVALGAGTSVAPEQRLTLRTYPNPSSGVLTVETAVVPELLVVRDLLGRALLRMQPEQLKNEIDLHELPEGTYLLEVHMGGEIRVERIVLQR